MSGIYDPANLELLVYWLTAAGMTFESVDSDYNILGLSEEDNNIADLMKAALGQAANSSEVQALREALTAANRLDTFLAAVNVPIRAARAARYRAETDPMLLSSFEASTGAQNVTIGGTTFRAPTAVRAIAWEAAKQAIRDALPYSE